MKRLHLSARVVVFDGSRCLYYRNMATPPAIDLRLESSHGQDNPPTRDQGTAPPARTNDSQGHRSSMETPDYHQIAEDRFAREVALDLALDIESGICGQVVIVAPPRALAAFRKSVSAPLRAAILLEVDKDLTKHQPTEVGTIVGKALEAASG